MTSTKRCLRRCSEPAGCDHEILDPFQLLESAFGDQRTIHGTKRACERRPDRRAKHHCLAVHRATRRDNEIGSGDEAAGVHGALGDDHAVEAERAHGVALLSRPRQHDLVHARIGRECAQHLLEQWIVGAVVERELRRRPHDREQRLGAHTESEPHRRIGLEPPERVLLLEAGEPHDIRRLRAVRGNRLERNRIGHEHACRQPAVDAMLKLRALVIEHRHRRKAEQSAHHRLVGRAVRQPDVEAARLGPLTQRVHAADRSAALAQA